MAKDSEKSNQEAQDAQADAAPSADAPEAARRRATIQVVDTKAVSSYANFCRVTGTPEELIVDFGLNSQPVGTPIDPIEINQRIIINFFTAKRLLAALSMSVQRHEQAFGVLETDVQKRVQPAARVAAAPSQ